MELNNIKTNGTWSVIAADLNQNFLKILTELLKYQHITTISGANFLGFFTSSSGLPTTDEAAWAIAGNLKSVTVYAYYTSDALPNGFVEGWNALTSLGTYDFTDYSELLSSIESLNRSINDMLQDIEHLKSNPNIDIVNNLTDGGTDKALSAEMGKQLGAVIYGGEMDVVTNINQDDFTNEDYNIISSSTRGVISVDISDADEYTATVNVKEDSPFKFAIHTTNEPLVWGSYIADTGWITAGKSRTVDKSFGSASYLRFATTNSSTNVPPTLEELKQNVAITFTKKAKKNAGGVEKRIEWLEEKVKDADNKIKDIEVKLSSPTFFNLSKIKGMTINTLDGAAANTDAELIDYVDVTGYNSVLVRGGFWNSTNRYWSSIIELYDQDKKAIQKIIPAELIGLEEVSYAYVFEGSIDVSAAAFIRFPNIIITPSSNTNVNFEPIEASVSPEYFRIETIQVIDKSNNKNQSEINAELNQTIFGNKGDIIEDIVTQDDLTEEDYLSTSTGNGRGFFNIPISAYDNYSLSLSVAQNSIVKAAVALTAIASYGDTIYDSTWLVAGRTSSVDNNTSVNPTIKFVQLRFTYISSGEGVPTIEEIKQYISIDFKGVKFADFGLVGKVSDLEKAIFPERTAGYKYQGEKVSFRDNAFTSEVIGSLSSGVSSRQGGAVFGDYLFQFHNTLETIVVYNLKTKNNVQTLTLPPISNHHAGSGGFGNEYYDSTDPFPILYISSMYENRVYGYRITGTEGSWAIETVQTITINKEGLYIPNIAIDRENNMVVVFGYTKNSWSDSNNNLSVITSFVLPKLSDGDVTIEEFSDVRKIPFIYAEQGAFARLGKLYLSYGNTISKCGMYVIDYISGIAVSHAPFEPLGNFEPEAFGLYEGNIIMTDHNGNIYKLTF